MKIWIKHLFGICKEPKSWDSFVYKKGQALPGSIIYMSPEEYHWWSQHAIQLILGDNNHV